MTMIRNLLKTSCAALTGLRRVQARLNDQRRKSVLLKWVVEQKTRHTTNSRMQA
jgi:hypothetical protein